MPFVSKLWSHWPFWTSPRGRMHGDVCLSSCFSVWAVSTTFATTTASFPVAFTCAVAGGAARLQLQPWVMVGILQVDPHRVLYALQLITVSTQPFSEMFDTTKTVPAVCMRSSAPTKSVCQWWHSTGWPDIPRRHVHASNIDQGRLPVYLSTPQHGRLLLVRSNVITWVELIEDLSR